VHAGERQRFDDEFSGLARIGRRVENTIFFQAGAAEREGASLARFFGVREWERQGDLLTPDTRIAGKRNGR